MLLNLDYYTGRQSKRTHVWSEEILTRVTRCYVNVIKASQHLKSLQTEPLTPPGWDVLLRREKSNRHMSIKLQTTLCLSSFFMRQHVLFSHATKMLKLPISLYFKNKHVVCILTVKLLWRTGKPHGCVWKLSTSLSSSVCWTERTREETNMFTLVSDLTDTFSSNVKKTCAKSNF